MIVYGGCCAILKIAGTMHYAHINVIQPSAVCARSSLRPSAWAYAPLRKQRSCRKVILRASSSDEIFREQRFTEFPLKSREAVLRAVENLGNSATAAEVASKAGLPIQVAEKLLQALAIEGSGSLKVLSLSVCNRTFLTEQNYHSEPRH